MIDPPRVSFDCIANASSFGRACDLLRIEYTAQLKGPRIAFSCFVRGVRTKRPVPDEAIRRLADVHGGIFEIEGYVCSDPMDV